MPDTLQEHSRDYALNQGAPVTVADAYAAWFVAEEAAGVYDGLEHGPSHRTEWADWRDDNLADCLQCGGPWALLCSYPVCWQCEVCGCSRPVA
jgi:hypothetical protein